MPLRMTPDFEDLSCEFAFGQAAASVEDDPLMQEVRHLCSASTCSDNILVEYFVRVQLFPPCF